MGFYILWQILYIIKVDILSKNDDMMTSAKWLLEKNRGSIYNLSIIPFGVNHPYLGFLLVQFVYNIVTLLPVKLLWDYQELHLFYLFFKCIIFSYNGANLYYSIFFAPKYIEYYEQCEKSILQLKKILT